MIGKGKLRSNLKFKEFPNGSRIELVYILTSAINARSKSAAEIIFDECQGFDADLELEVRQCQSASRTPVTIYAGTSLTTDTFLEHKFAMSSSAYWVTKCGCGHYNIPLPEYDVMSMIRPLGPSCSKCGRLLDMTTGKFIHAHPERVDRLRVGYHIPQLIVPAVYNNPIRWSEIYNLKLTGDERKFKQEILGIPTEEGEREITKQQLIAICTLGGNMQNLRERAASGYYKYVVSGLDWGGTDHLPDLKIKVSTTVHVIMGITSAGERHILHIRRYPGMDYDDIVDDILHNHKVLRGNALASDFGVGAVYNSKIRERIGPECHLIFNYTGPTTAYIGEPKSYHMFNQWALNKTESISMTYEAIRKLHIRCYEWEKSGEFLMDALNMFRAPAEKKGESGMVTFIYRSHASKPNDTLQAINYAYTLSKILLGSPMFADASLKIRLENSLASGMRYMRGENSGAHAFSG